MTPDLMTLCALVPPLRRIARDPLLGPLADRCLHQGDAAPLAQAVLNQPDLACELLTAAGLPEDKDSLCVLLSGPMLSYIHVFGQCAAGELLEALSCRTVLPTPEGLTLLLSRSRRREAQTQYALQLLWHMAGGSPLPSPDAVAMNPALSSDPSSQRRRSP